MPATPAPEKRADATEGKNEADNAPEADIQHAEIPETPRVEPVDVRAPPPPPAKEAPDAVSDNALAQLLDFGYDFTDASTALSEVKKMYRSMDGVPVEALVDAAVNFLAGSEDPMSAIQQLETPAPRASGVFWHPRTFHYLPFDSMLTRSSPCTRSSSWPAARYGGNAIDAI